MPGDVGDAAGDVPGLAREVCGKAPAGGPQVPQGVRSLRCAVRAGRGGVEEAVVGGQVVAGPGDAGQAGLRCLGDRACKRDARLQVAAGSGERGGIVGRPQAGETDRQGEGVVDDRELDAHTRLPQLAEQAQAVQVVDRGRIDERAVGAVHGLIGEQGVSFDDFVHGVQTCLVAGVATGQAGAGHPEQVRLPQGGLCLAAHDADRHLDLAPAGQPGPVRPLQADLIEGPPVVGHLQRQRRGEAVDGPNQRRTGCATSDRSHRNRSARGAVCRRP